MDDMTTHAIFSLCLDDVVVLSQWRYDLFAKATEQLCFKHDAFSLRKQF